MLTRLKLWLGAAAVAFAAFFGIWLAGISQGQQKARTRALLEDQKANGRMNDADTGDGASDADNVAWLRDFHDKHQR